MRNRWFHRPLLHSPGSGLEKKATWLELFYDLIFVAAFIQLGNGLANHVSIEGFAAFAGAFVPLWLAWTGFTFYENRYTVDDFLHRTLVLLQMFAVGGMAISAPGVLVGDIQPFAIATAIAQLMVAAMYLRTWPQITEGRDYTRFWGLVFGLGGALWLISAFVPSQIALWIWGISTVGVLTAPLSPASRTLNQQWPIDFEHLGERYGLLTLIVLGESFVKILTALSGEQAGLEIYLEAGVVLLITCGIWWVYFDDIAGSHIRKGPGAWIIWLYAHIPLQLGITAVGVSIKKAVHFTWDAPAPEKYRWLLAGSLALVYFAVAAIDSVTERRQAELSDRARVNVRWISALGLLVLAPAGATMSGGMFLALVTAINVAQVLFDMMMAPLEAAEHLEIGMRSTADLAREAEESGKPKVRARRDMSEAVRKGAPAELRRDLYFYFIEGSWTRVFAAFAFLFLVVNVFFAALYTLEPGSIAGAGESFADAFFFSVQTISTIGYGSLSPATPYGNAVVSLEAALGIIGVAIATGLIFAKVSRAHASVLFSKPVVLTRMHGKRTLIFRAGNARGNEVVDATATLAVLKDELSSEGHHLTRLHDLRLRRSRSPLFVLSWAIMHEIDEDSPLRDVDWSDPESRSLTFIATLMGHDGTYGQTIYARHLYRPEDLQVDARFVDIISQLEDGRLMIDYSKFHDTEPESPDPVGDTEAAAST